MKTTIAISAFSLVLSLLTPWYFISALAAGIYSFKTRRDHKEILLQSLSVALVHSLAAVVLDFRASMLISQRVAGLFHLPWFGLFYIVAGLIPGLVFLTTAHVVLESRSLVKRGQKISDKRR